MYCFPDQLTRINIILITCNSNNSSKYFFLKQLAWFTVFRRYKNLVSKSKCHGIMIYHYYRYLI